MTRDDIFNQDRNEKTIYEQADDNEEVLLPITKLGFEALLVQAALIYELPIDNPMRNVLAGYIHHIPNEQNTTTIGQIAKVLYKSISNSTTWRIDQEIKLKAKEEAEKKAKELAESLKEDAQILPINKD